jgi:hypothetical protein
VKSLNGGGEEKERKTMFEERRTTFLAIGVIAALLIVGVSFFTYRALRARQAAPGTNEPIACTLDAKVCPDGTAVGRVAPSCEFAPCPEAAAPQTPQNASCTPGNLKVNLPLENARVSSTFRIVGVVDNRTNKDCTWTLFEGRAGQVTVKDMTGVVVAEAPLETVGDWMTDGPVNVVANISLAGQPAGTRCRRGTSHHPRTK